MQISPLLRHAAAHCCSSPGICVALSWRVSKKGVASDCIFGASGRAGFAANGGSSGSDPQAVEVTTIESIDREAGEADNGFYYLALHGNIIYVSDYRNNVILSNHTGEQVVTLTLFCQNKIRYNNH